MSKQAELRERIDTVRGTIKTAFDQAGGADGDYAKIETFGLKGDAVANVEKVRELNTHLSALVEEVTKSEMAEIKAASERAGLSPRPNTMTHPEPATAEAKSLGDMFVNSDEYKEGVQRVHKTFAVKFDDFEVKTLFATGAGWEPEARRNGDVVPFALRPIQALDLFPQPSTSQSAIVYMEETTHTNNAAETAESGVYPENAYEFTERTSPVRKIAASLPVTDEQLQDVDQAREFINSALQGDLRRRLDAQVIAGAGTGILLNGLLNVATGSVEYDDELPDAVGEYINGVLDAMTNVRITGRAQPNAILAHPTDVANIKKLRTSDGMYVYQHPAVAGPMSLWGLPMVECESVPVGSAVVGDFARYAQLWIRRGIEVQAGYVGSQFTSGQLTLRADMRAALVFRRPSAFCILAGDAV